MILIRRMTLLLAALLAGLLTMTACGPNIGSYAGYYDGICVSPITQVRMPDAYCGLHPSYWYYVPYGYVTPGIHVHVSHYSRTHYHVPSGATSVHRGGVSTSGGKAPHFNSGTVNLKKNTNTKTGKTGGGSTKPKGSIFKRSGGFGSSRRSGKR